MIHKTCGGIICTATVIIVEEGRKEGAEGRIYEVGLANKQNVCGGGVEMKGRIQDAVSLIL